MAESRKNTWSADLDLLQEGDAGDWKESDFSLFMPEDVAEHSRFDAEYTSLFLNSFTLFQPELVKQEPVAVEPAPQFELAVEPGSAEKPKSKRGRPRKPKPEPEPEPVQRADDGVIIIPDDEEEWWQTIDFDAEGNATAHPPALRKHK